MDQSQFDSAFPGLDFAPDAGQEFVFETASTATGGEEVYDRWGGGPDSGWLLLRSRYGETDPMLCRAVRVRLARGARCVVRPRP